MKVRIMFASGEGANFDLDDNTKLTKNFTLKEVANNKATDKVKMEFYPDFFAFIQMIQELRDWKGKPMTVNSCYRTELFNAKCGGSKNSLHLKGYALDWGVKDQGEMDRMKVKAKWKSICEAHGFVGGINYYSNGYHLSIHEEQFGNHFFISRDYRGKEGDW